MVKTRQILSTCFRVFSKNFAVIVNDGEYTWRIEDGVSPLQLFSCDHELADSRFAIHASKSSGNVVLLAKHADVLMLLIYSCSICGISKEWVLNDDTSSYANIGIIGKCLENTVGRNRITVPCDYRLWYNFIFLQNRKNQPIQRSP